MYLTKHQRKILEMLRDGKTYTQVASELQVVKGSIGANLTWAAARNGLTSISDLRKAVQYVDLTKPPTIKRAKVAGIHLTEAGTYRVSIWYGKRKRAYIGTFRTEKQAVTARLEAEKKYRAVSSQ